MKLFINTMVKGPINFFSTYTFQGFRHIAVEVYKNFELKEKYFTAEVVHSSMT